MSIIKAEDLSVGYGKKAIINGISIEAEKGEIICLIGPNGAGKTTILRTVSGLLAPIKNTVYINGEEIGKIDKPRLAKQLSVVLTDNIRLNLTTVYDLVSMGRIPYTNMLGKLSPKDKDIIDAALETVGASELAERYCSELSDGEKQKIMIARALVQEPQLIILDEPTSHLDIRHKVEIIRVLQKLAHEKGITVLLSLHDIDLAVKGCGKVILTAGGKVIASGCPEDIISDGVISSLYQIDNAAFNETLCSVEFYGARRNDVFVVCGDGRGINVIRALTKKGLGVTAGVVHENDTDFSVAGKMCSEIVTAQAFEPIDRETAEKAVRLMENAAAVIDAGTHFGTMNSENIEIIRKALASGKPVISLRERENSDKLFGEGAICIKKISEAVGLTASAVEYSENRKEQL